MYKKSNTKLGKIKTQDIQILVNSTCEEKVHLRTYDITFSGYLFMVRPILIFSKSSSITDYIQFYDSDSSFTTLATLFCKTAHKNTSFLSDYSDYADLHENQCHHWLLLLYWYSWQHEKWFHHWIRWLPSFQYQRIINSTTNFADYAGFRVYMLDNFIITTLTTQIFMAIWKTTSSLTKLTTLILETS